LTYFFLSFPRTAWVWLFFLQLSYTKLSGNRLDSIDKEAKLTGSYHDRKNKPDLDKVVRGFRIWEKHWPEAPNDVRE